MSNQTETLDRQFDQNSATTERNKINTTAIEMMQRFKMFKDQKLDKVEYAKDLFMQAVNGTAPTRANQMSSYILNQLVTNFVGLTKVPDFRMVTSQASDDVMFLASKYVEKKMKEGGFYKIMKSDWSAYHDCALYGSFFVVKGRKQSGNNKGMPEFRGLSIGAFEGQVQATSVSSQSSGQRLTRYGAKWTYDVEEAEQMFPGIMKNAIPGKLPVNNEWDDKTDGKDDTQKSDEEADRNIEIMFFVDELYKVSAVIAGSNAYVYSSLERDDFPYMKEVDGEQVATLNLEHLKMTPAPEGFYGIGFGEMFSNISETISGLNTALVNNVKDNSNAPEIYNIDSVDSKKLIQQIKLANEKRERGERAAIIPTLSKDAQKQGRGLGNGTIDKLTTPYTVDGNNQVIDLANSEIQRMGYNLDLRFTDSTKTLGQTELDIRGANATVSEFQDNNIEFYRGIIQFTLDSIKEFGNTESNTQFGLGVKLEDDELGEFEVNITEGMLVKKIQEITDWEIEVDTKNGVVFNDTLEERNLLRKLNHLPDGSPEQVRTLSQLSVLRGGKPLKQADVEGQAGVAPEVQGTLEQELAQ